MNIIANAVSTVVYGALVAAAAPIALMLLSMGGEEERAVMPNDEHELGMTARAQRSPVG